MSPSDSRTIDERPAIVYFGNDWFAENQTSSHQIARHLAKSHRLIYVECPGLRAPKGSTRDLRKLLAKVRRFFQGARAVEDGVVVQTLLQIPLHRFKIVRQTNQWLILLTLRWLFFRQGIRRPISWFMVPHVASVAGRLGERLVVYYCIDDYAALPDVDVPAVQAMDEHLTRQADLVFVASRTLLDAKRALNPQTRLSPHGVDVDHFAQAATGQLTTPPDVAELPRPVIGFFGLIERWIDLELVAFLAQSHPEWTFLMIGRVAVEETPRLPNLHFLGTRKYQLLPAYAGQFDVAIIPYRLTRQVINANPIKLREYLATGRPVVSVRTPEIERYADVVAIADDRDQFLALVDQAVAEGRDPASGERRRARVAPERWDRRIDEVLAHVEEALSDSIDREAATRPNGYRGKDNVHLESKEPR